MSTGFTWFLLLQTPFLYSLSFLIPHSSHSILIPSLPHHIFSPSTEAMNKFEKPQILVFSLIAILLIIAPLLSSSLRTPYLYIITNILIIALGAQAGLLSSFSNPSNHDKKNSIVSAAHKPVIASELTSSGKRVVSHNDEDQTVVSESADTKAKVVEKSKSEKIVDTVKVDIVKKCPSMPSLFFIGGGETDQADHGVIEDNHEVEEEEEGDLSGKELFTKAETFIGNFYKQLKMQREDSWKKIHEFYHKAF